MIEAVIFMKVSRLLPKRFSARLIVMTFISGLIPIIIFTLLMNIFDDRFLTKINWAIQQGQEEQWQRSEAVLKQMAEDFVRQKALDVALQLELYLQAHPAMTVADLQNDPKFREMAVQPVGKTGYTTVHDSDTVINRFHRNPRLENLDPHSLSHKLPDFEAILEASLDGRYSRGYYQWKEPNGDLRDKFMYIAPLSEKTAEGVRFGVAATTYIEEFTRSIQAAQDVSHSTTRYLTMTANRLIESFGTTGFLFMGIGVALVLALACWAGIYFSRAITHLREATRAVNQGDFDVRLKRTMSGDVGELIEDFNQMIAQLATTTVRKEQLEASEKNLKTTNEKLHREITERKRAEAELRKSQEKYKALFEESKKAEEVYRSLLHSSADGIVIYDFEGRTNYISPAFTQLFGWKFEEVKGKRIPFLPESETEATLGIIKELVENGKPCHGFETKRYTKNGHLLDVSISASRYDDHEGKPAGTLAILRDISDRKKLEAQLQQAQRMEAIGTLAGGVAHDLNNILSGIVSYPELILMELPEDSSLRKPILTIQKSGEKAAVIVQDLLTLARRGVAISEVVNLNHIISEQLKSPEFEKLLSFHTDVQVKTHLEKDLLNIKGSSDHLSKSVMNIFSNAIEAMPDGGTILISTENLCLDRPIKGYNHVESGEYVTVTVSDTGMGISEKDLKRIFEPFYTKKVMGRSGTGLGMAVVWGTVKDHKGYIDTHSTVGKGTAFTLYFPVTRKEIAKDESLLPIVDYMGNGELILVVDDVEEQREIATGMLRKLGYSVTSVSSGEEAVEYLKTNSADLIVLDMIMEPGINGRETYERIIKYHPNQKAIIASGFSETDDVKTAQILGAGEYIKKPYTLKKIGIAVRDELKK